MAKSPVTSSSSSPRLSAINYTIKDVDETTGSGKNEEKDEDYFVFTSFLGGLHVLSESYIEKENGNGKQGKEEKKE